jgi:hypothetical protein
MTTRAYQYVDLSGYGFSGKHAVIDLLREFRGYAVPHFQFEFLLLRIQGGILDLETALHNDWSPIRSDAAIRRFRRLVRRLGVKNSLRYPRSLFEAVGWNYDDRYANRFLTLSEEYLDRLVDASWVNDWPYPRADLTGSELFVRKVLQRIGVKQALDFRVYLSFPRDFVSATRQYLDAILSSNVPADTTSIVMHNAFEPFQPQRCFKYFERVKCIIVDRDPRDTYVQQLTYRPMAVGVEDFIRRFRIYREAARRFWSDDPRILRLQFETLVTRYEESVSRVLAHLEEPPEVHQQRRRYFDPDQSARNVGIWKSHPDPRAIDLIQRELGEYCHG